MRAVWLNDIHLNFLDRPAFARFVEGVRRCEADCVLLAGDIAEAPSVVRWLETLAAELATPIHFVLGNHDFFGGSIRDVRARVAAASREGSGLTYLTASGAVPLSGSAALVGHDGWGDARLGDAAGSRVQLNDFLLIEELAGLKRDDLLRRLGELGDEAAAHLGRALDEAFGFARHAVVLTHVPPFAGAAWHDGRTSDPEWLPFFSCKAAGDALLGAMSARPDRRMTVLCGHTHGGGRVEILPNLVVHTGAARYGYPAVQALLDWP